MNEHYLHDAVFLRKQRRYLLGLRKELVSAARADEDDEGEVRRESIGAPREYGDDAQKLAFLEIDGNRVVRSLRRLARVDRALDKIKVGTYGLSDVTGRPIPRDRLEASPEAICTLDEEEAFEHNAIMGGMR
jgi:DnaK suppressor protein